MPIIVPSRELQVGLSGLESECLKTRAMLRSCKILVSKLMEKVLLRFEKWPYFKS
jgi:hypothetical protein